MACFQGFFVVAALAVPDLFAVIRLQSIILGYKRLQSDYKYYILLFLKY